ncbi:nucleotidyltransferase [Flavobacterium sp. GA093]|uniref:Nucleotidyltransferase n=1 Tax=Flavobacterium hydrocarbonoxydans TaxID=2683249 RepID=A0A6I4NEF1_9FLAO|nr:nucleotidyltransferase [Flavobacterium hydrocarbonoxydans]MWB92996.1 nucleotidyltransferase [Flavobacterium hydrocarbonoxydans]
MARTKTQIKSEITTPFMANETLSVKYGFAVGASFDSEFSIYSLENILFEIVALAIYLHEQFFDQHKKEVDEKLANEKSGTLPWYRTMALRFQDGFDLVPDQDYFDNGTATPEQIENSKIIKYSAVNEAEDSSRVIVKIAGETAGVLSPITQEQKDAFELTYMKEIKWAGIQITVINYLPDKLYLIIQIKRDALVLSSTGQSILYGNYPVNDAIEQFLKELPFDGDLRLSAIVDKLQTVPGVKDATILSAKSAWINPDTDGYESPLPINISTIPVSGYFEIQGFQDISYVV